MVGYPELRIKHIQFQKSILDQNQRIHKIDFRSCEEIILQYFYKEAVRYRVNLLSKRTGKLEVNLAGTKDALLQIQVRRG
jgi:hypothetical protein